MFKFSRLLIAYAVAVPLALFLGYLMVVPGMLTILIVAMLLFFFSLPLLLRWHHFLLIVFWNTVFNFFFLPGSPDMWLLLAALSFSISILNHIIFQKSFLHAPELTRPLFLLAAVVLVTAWYRGGIGIRALGGSSFGGRYYIFILVAIAGYFALTAEQIPGPKARKMAFLFLAGGMTSALSNIIYMMGPTFYFLYNFVPSGGASGQAASDYGLTTIDRIAGLGPACIAGLCLLLAVYGVRGLFDVTRPWRLALLLVTVGASFLAGYRSIIVVLFLIFAVQFYLEGLLHTHFLPIVISLAICGFVPVLFFSDKMPTSIQRAISFLPVNVNTDVLEDAKGSADWRFEMWAAVAKELPKYLIIGKGYGFDPNELYSIQEAQRTGVAVNSFEGSMIAGDYHSGPLSVIIPFGIGGAVAFAWVLAAGYRILVSNYRFGEARLRRINTTFLAYYVASCISFVFVFGALNSQLYIFLGICGMSISLNGGVKRRALRVKPTSALAARTVAMEPG